MRMPALLLCLATLCAAQAQQPKLPDLSPQEQADFDQTIGIAGTSQLEFLRAVEKHLAKYPDSPRRADLERAAASAAITANDDARIVTFGERVLARQPDDLQLLGRVTHSLAASDSKDAAERAVKYAHRTQELILQYQKDNLRTAKSQAEFLTTTDRALGRSFVDEARATATLGKPQAALSIAQRAFEIFPNAESSRAIARCYELLDQLADAAGAMADAFTIQDPYNSDADRAIDRARLGDLYHRAHKSDTGLGDLVLAAYDRNLALIHARELRLRQNDPNANLTDPMEFTLSGLNGDKLAMSSLKGRVVVLDLWATWCVPCRAQHPLYEQVKQRFLGNPNVVFLSVNTDEDRAPVRLFVDDLKWKDTVWFEDGLARALKVDSLPMTLIIGTDGKIFTRMNGFVAELFVDSLTNTIQEALTSH